MIRFKKDEVILDGLCTCTSTIPSNYTHAQYIINNAADVKFDTGIIIDNADFEIEVKVQPSAGSWYILQTRYEQNSNIFGLTGSVSRNTIIFYFNATTYVTSSIVRNINHIYTIKASLKDNEGTLYVYDMTSGEEDTKTISVPNFTPNTRTLNIFGNQLNQYVQPGTYLYYARIWQNNNLVFDAVPVYEASNIYLYDFVRKDVITGVGTIQVGEAVTAQSPDYVYELKCNNGVIKSNNGTIYTSGDVEVVKDIYNNTAAAQMLLGNGTIYDTQDVNSGRIYRNTYIYVFKGTETWSYNSEYDCFYMSQHLPAMRYPKFLLCNGFVTIPYTTRTDGMGYIYMNRFFIRYGAFNGKVSILKKFLANRYAKNEPIIAIYQLDTPIEEYTTPEPLDISEVIQIDGSLPNLPIHTAPTTAIKHRFITDNLGQSHEVKKVYQGSHQIYTAPNYS